MKVLLIEPNRLLARQYCQFLESNGHEVAWREDAQSGINAADELNPNVVIVELLLAGHSGIEFLYEFRSYADWLNVPAIILSTTTRSSIGIPEDTLNELGVGAYLYKAETSLAKLEEVLQKLTIVSDAL